MTASPAPVSPVPSAATPGTVKTLGWLNVAFGALLMLCVTGFDAYLVLLPYGQRKLEETQHAAQADRQARRDAEIQALRAQEAKAETPEEKARIRAESIVLESTPLENIPSASVDLSTLGLDDPRVRTHYAVDGVTALILNLLMIVAGIGLIRLARWGRRLALWVAAIKLARLVLVGGSLILVVQPVTNTRTLQNGAPGETVEADGSAMPLAWVMALSTLVYLTVCAAYPIVVLVLLTRPGARAAVENPVATRNT